MFEKKKYEKDDINIISVGRIPVPKDDIPEFTKLSDVREWEDD